MRERARRIDKGWRPLVAKFALLSASLLVALLLGEIGLRIIGFRYVFYPDKIEFGWPDPKEFSNVYTPDPELMWTQPYYGDHLAEAAEKGVDIVFMGCSCTEFGKYDRYLIEAIEQENPGSAVSYLNVGVGGWTSHQGLRQMKRDVLPLRPKVVVIYYGWNDHWFGFGIPDKQIESYRESPLYPLRNLRLMQLAMKMSVALGQKAGGNRPPRVAPEDFRENLREMVRLAGEAGIVPVLATAPTSYIQGREYAYLARRWMSDPSQVVPVHDAYAEIVRQVAAETSVPLADLKTRFEDLPTTAVLRQYFQMDGIHLRPEGDRVLAGFLHDTLKSAGIESLLLGSNEGGQPARLSGRDYPGGGAPIAPPKEHHEGNPPVVLTIDKIKYSKKRGDLRVRGWALAPEPIDHVVIFVEGKNLGAANYPLQDFDLPGAHPEYNDPWGEFLFERPVPPELRRESISGEVVTYSGDSEIQRLAFTAED